MENAFHQKCNNKIMYERKLEMFLLLLTVRTVYTISTAPIFMMHLVKLWQIKIHSKQNRNYSDQCKC